MCSRDNFNNPPLFGIEIIAPCLGALDVGSIASERVRVSDVVILPITCVCFVCRRHACRGLHVTVGDAFKGPGLSVKRL